MKKVVTYAVMLAYLTVTLLPVQAHAQQYDRGYRAAQQYQPGGKPKVAVYVSEHSGYSNEEKSALRTVTLNALVKSGRYNVIERSNIIEAELQKQASGAVDDDQLTAFGRQAGAQYVCIADMIFLRNRSESIPIYGYNANGSRYVSGYNHNSFKDYQVSVRMIDVETAEVLAFGLIEPSIADGQEMVHAISVAVNTMLKTVQSAKAANMPKMAVYVTGSKTGQREGNALYSYALEALFTRSRNLGTFKVIERADAFTRQIDREQITQRSGHVDDRQISRLGKQYGIERILVASMEYAMNTYTVSSRIINIETASVENASKTVTTNSDLDGLGTVSVGMVEEMMGLTRAEIDYRTAESAAAAATAAAESDRRAAIVAESERKQRILGYVGLVCLGIIIIWSLIEGKNSDTVSAK